MNIAIVTGASSGMGREFVLQLPNYVSVDEIWVIARRQAALESLKEESALPIRPIPLDLCDSGSFSAFAAILEAEKPNVKLLVKALVMMTRLAVPYMAPGSHILQLDSLSAFQPVPYITTYGATKSFVLSYSRAMNRELKPLGIRCMSMNPGWVKTEFFNHAVETNGDNEVQYYNRLWEAKDVVATGLKDLYKTRKDYSIHGFSVRMQVRAVKLLPHNMVMNTWLDQQKKPKNNQDLTVEGRK